MGTTSKRYPTEFRERALRLVAEQQVKGGSQGAAIGSVASKLPPRRETSK